MSTEKSSTSYSYTGVHPRTALSSEAASNNNDELQKTTNANEESDGPLLLPTSNADDPSIPKIQLGDTISFEEMGPVIINPDSTTRRIDNWDQMTKSEQEVAWRRISKRNAERRAALLEKQKEMEQDGKNESS
jgi:hypothetical protein